MRPVRASSGLNSDANREDRRQMRKDEYISPYQESKGNNDYKHSHHRSLGSISGGSRAAGPLVVQRLLYARGANRYVMCIRV